jgi:hypothetical protein
MVLLFVGSAIEWVLESLWLILPQILPFLVMGPFLAAVVWLCFNATKEDRAHRRKLREDRRSFLSAQADMRRLYKNTQRRFYR